MFSRVEFRYCNSRNANNTIGPVQLVTYELPGTKGVVPLLSQRKRCVGASAVDTCNGGTFVMPIAG